MSHIENNHETGSLAALTSVAGGEAVGRVGDFEYWP